MRGAIAILFFYVHLCSVNAEILQLERIAAGLDRPVFVSSAPGDNTRIFIVEQHTGNILVHDTTTGQTNASPFLTVNGISTGSEQGLLGLAFHPDYSENGFFYTNSTTAGETVIQRFEVLGGDPDIADPNSAHQVLSFSQPQSNHNGGWMDFGPDGFLYVGTGDGGGGHDNGSGHTTGIGNAQDLMDNLHGKILRIDVNGDDFTSDPDQNYSIPASNPFVGSGGDDEIWAYGLRNPWRSSFDRVTGDLIIGDVGQSTREEINFQYASSLGGENYGWRLREGTISTPTGGVGGAFPPDGVDPIYEYPNGSGPTEGIAVTGGYVYRGPVDSLEGSYLFGDFSGRLWSFEFDSSSPNDFDGMNIVDFTDWTDSIETDIGTLDTVSSFGEDESGDLYVVDLDGDVFRVQAVIPEPKSVVFFISMIVIFMTLIKFTKLRSGRSH